MPTRNFVVDASLLQELGERLIGRPAIALGELVKNAFDADATLCRIEFGTDEITVTDNGRGMSEEDFLNHWMRIGTTHKIDERVSQRYKRPLTGSKGIGRLSVQFLANELSLDSTPTEKGSKGIHAHVDWTTAIRGSELSKVLVEWDRGTTVSKYAGESPFGARITLSGLKNEWGAETIQELGNDVWMLRSPFRDSARTSKRSKRDDFAIEIEAPAIVGAREAFDRTLNAVFGNWNARIRGSIDHGRAGGNAIVAVEFRAGYPKGSDKPRQFQTTISLPIRSDGTTSKPLIDRASFEVHVFKTVGRQQSGIAVGDLREYLGKFGNVSVYDAGFRLPYYGSKRDKVGEDWLSIAADQGRRLNQSELLPERLRTQNKYMQDLPAPGRIFGAVDIDTNHERRAARRSGPADYLQIQPGRDRLHDNQAFYQLKDLVRFSLDFYANRFRLLSLEAVEQGRSTERPSKKFKRVIELVDNSKSEMPAAVYRAVRRELVDAVEAREAEEGAIDQRAALLAPLASAGMAALALNHEIAREARFLDRIGRRLAALATKYSLDELATIAKEFKQAKNRLDSLRELFAPLLSDADKSTTDRLRVREVVEQTVNAMSVLMPGVQVQFSTVPADLRFPLGSLAEWSALLQNVLANAWNALLDRDRRLISFSAGREGRGLEWLRISDTGQGLGLPVNESERLFEPFERRIVISPDKRSIAIGGQGLGLAIVRMIANRRGMKVAFVEPQEGFSTTLECSWRGVR